MSGYTYGGNKPLRSLNSVESLAQWAAETPADPDEELLNMPDERFSWGKTSNRIGACLRGCCWNPFAVCYYRRRCHCHYLAPEVQLPVYEDDLDEEAQEDYLAPLIPLFTTETPDEEAQEAA